MANLRVLAQEGEFLFRYSAGDSVRDILDTTDLRVRAACGGTGSCGACVVRLSQGEANPHTLAEYQKLTAEERQQGVRLACQLRPKGDAEIRLDHPAPPSHWKSIPAEDLAPPPGRLPNLERHIYGVAVDLGTTHIRVALWDRKRGQRIATRRGPNPQGVFGADVLNRLDAARARPERAAELARLARAAIVQAVRDILARDVGEVTPMLAEIGQVMLVGNTAMLALLTGRGGEVLLAPDNWERAIDCRPEHPDAWQAQWYMPNAAIALPDPIAGFIGSDLVADLIATRLMDGPPGSLLLDVGTNTEIALWDGRRLLVTSVPGGPAFEGVGIRFGMAAEPGAICRVRATAGPTFACDTIAGAAARGYCGSGLADAVAVLLGAGVLKPSGRFAVAPGPEGYRLDPANPRSALTGGDVDAFQRAKAATAAAMAELLKLAGLGWRDLSRLVVCGAFGRTLDVTHAQAVGLLPAITPDRIELLADATLAGCERALLAEQGERLFARINGLAHAVNLSLIEGYDNGYIENLRLRPIQATLPVEE
jgi:uncharacterized 2Fe-2S/4Fe-4S cluster protein (DUF4445 family)